MNIKNKINLSLIFFLILAIFLLAFLIYPLLKDIKNYSNEIISQKKVIRVFRIERRTSKTY